MIVFTSNNDSTCKQQRWYLQGAKTLLKGRHDGTDEA